MARVFEAYKKREKREREKRGREIFGISSSHHTCKEIIYILRKNQELEKLSQDFTGGSGN